jgi:hypothetical protein
VSDCGRGYKSVKLPEISELTNQCRREGLSVRSKSKRTSSTRSWVRDTSPVLQAGALPFYICEKYFQGESHQIKEYSIRCGRLRTFGRFPPKEDPIVRVEASVWVSGSRNITAARKAITAVTVDSATGPIRSGVSVFGTTGGASAHEIQVKLRSQVDSLAKIDPTTLVVNPKKGVLNLREQTQPIRSRRQDAFTSLVAIGIILGGCIVFWLPPDSASTKATGIGQHDHYPTDSFGPSRRRFRVQGVKFVFASDPLARNISISWAKSGMRIGSLRRCYVRASGGCHFSILEMPQSIRQAGKATSVTIFRYSRSNYELRLHFAETTTALKKSRTTARPCAPFRPLQWKTIV